MRWTTMLITVAVLATASRFGLAADEAPKSVYDPTEFTLSYWCGPPAKFLSLARFQEVEEANFTLALPPCGGLTVEQNRAMLDFCQQVGIRAIISDSRMVRSLGGSEEKKQALDAIVKDYADHPALLGYHVVDEPNAGAFDGLAEVTAYLKQKDPKHPAYINLLPTYATEAQLGTKTYEQYVRAFAQKVKPFVLSYDHYALTNSGDRADFFENLATVRKVALEEDIPFWNIVLVTQHFGYRRLTEAELRFEAMQTLAFGAKGLLWFTYWMPAGVPAPESWKHAMIHADGRRDAHYDMVQRVNAEAKAIGDVLAQAKSTAVFHHGEGATIERNDSSPIVPDGGKLTVGVFEGPRGKTLALVTNRDYKQATQTRVAARPAGAKIEVFDPARKKWSPAKMVEGGVALNIPAGGGVLLRW
jgi:hypothetical protein